MSKSCCSHCVKADNQGPEYHCIIESELSFLYTYISNADRDDRGTNRLSKIECKTGAWTSRFVSRN